MERQRRTVDQRLDQNVKVEEGRKIKNIIEKVIYWAIKGPRSYYGTSKLGNELLDNK